jgi:hypothetical protein
MGLDDAAPCYPSVRGWGRPGREFGTKLTKSYYFREPFPE